MRPPSKKHKHWARSRVSLGMLLFFVAVGLWVVYRPQYRPLYQEAVQHYQQGEYHIALAELDRAYQIAPNAVEVLVMLGWTNLKLKRYEEAGFYFGRAIRLDPRLNEARQGAALVAQQRPQKK